MKKDTFIFYLEWLRTMEGASLTKTERSRLIDAIISYVDTDVVPELPRLLMAIFLPIKATLDRDKEKYDARIEANRTNGRKGGRPKTQKNPKNPTVILENPTKPKKADNDNVNDNDNDNVNVICAFAEEEKKGIYEIFFWRNLADPAGELERFVAYNSKRRWKALPTPAKRLEAAMEWQPADSAARVKAEFLQMWKAMHDRIAAEYPKVAEDMLDAGSKCLFYSGKAKICARDSVRDFINRTNPPEIRRYIGKYELTTSWS